MNDNLVVRVFNVGVGDCIYVRVPDGNDIFHILIDCGTFRTSDSELLDEAIGNIKKCLPPASEHRSNCPPDDKWLDLLVVTHPDSDHTNGFGIDGAKRFKDLRIGQIWLTPLLNKKHPQAQQSYALMDVTDFGSKALLAGHEKGILALDEYTRELLQSRTKEDSLTNLRADLDPDCPRLYMCRDFADPGKVSKTQGSVADFKFEKNATCFCGFKDPGTKIRILAPEWDIDGEYLGKNGVDHPDYRELLAEWNPKDKRAGPTASKQQSDCLIANNIGAADFWQLRNGMQYSALRFLGSERPLQNNTSLVLLLEWKGHRLLFPGDAECEGPRSSWKIMLKSAKSYLMDSLDFLKVGHHGSINATPYKIAMKKKQLLLDVLLDITKSRVVVSTKAHVIPTKTNPVPHPTIMKELGKRASNARKYPEDTDWGKQPRRTDREDGGCIEEKFPPSG